MGALLLPEVLVTICGLAVLWVIWVLRDRPEDVAVPVGRGWPDEPPSAAEADPPAPDRAGPGGA